VLGSVQRDQRSPTQALEPRQWSGCPDRLEEQRVERGWRGTIQQLTDIVVAEDRRYAEQRLAVRAARWCARNEGLPMKNIEKVDRPMSAIV